MPLVIIDFSPCNCCTKEHTLTYNIRDKEKIMGLKMLPKYDSWEPVKLLLLALFLKLRVCTSNAKFFFEVVSANGEVHLESPT